MLFNPKHNDDKMSNNTIKELIIKLCTASPIRLSFLLSLINFDFLMPILKKYYGEEWRWKKFSMIVMFKLFVFRILKSFDHSRVIAYLICHEQEAREIGFTDTDGNICLPDHETQRHWEKERLGVHGLNTIFNAIVERIRFLLIPLGIVLGLNIGEDSTMIRSCANDKKAEYNGHYKEKGYKGDITIDVDLGIPIAKRLTGANDYDGDNFAYTIDDLHKRGIYPKHFVGDNHYATYSNYFYGGYLNGIKMHCNFSSDAIYRYDATEEQLFLQYRKLWHDSQYKNNPDFRDVGDMLIKHGKQELIGACFRNYSFHEYVEDPDGYLGSYHQRSKDESINGILTTETGFEKMKVLGRKNADMHLSAHLIAILVIALLRVQFGITGGLMKIGGIM